jgi:dipeptidyl-peptidase 4
MDEVILDINSHYKTMKNNYLLGWALVCLMGTFSIAQKNIAFEDLALRPTFSQESVYGINWMNDGQYYSALESNNIVKYDVTKGEKVATLLDGATLEPRISFSAYSFSADEKQVLLMTKRESIYRRSFKAEYYLYDFTSKTLRPLSPNGKQSYATFSPDGKKIAFVRDNNLFYVELEGMKEVQVTDDGRFNHIINGSSDWVYEEEFSFAKAFFWSPDSRKLAYYRFDESEVKEYNMQMWKGGQLYPDDYKFKYPKAGEANAVVEIFVYHLEDGKKVKVDIGTEKDMYIPRINWTKNAEMLSVRRLNRLQNELHILHVNATTGATTLALKEVSETFVDVDYCDDLTYLADGKHFIHSSEQDGFKHLYLYTLEGKLVRQITQGNWEVEGFVGIDDKKKKATLYYISTEGSPMERYFFSIDIEGKNKKRLTAAAGTHSVNVSNDFKYFIDYHSSATQPLRVTLHRLSNNSLVKELKNNDKLAKTAEEFGLRPKEFFTFKNTTGIDLNGYMLRPANFDESQQYPVLIFQYSGPGSQNVTNAFGGGHYYWHQMLTQKGFVVAVVDTRGTGGRGAAFKKATYKQLGKLETEDHISAAKYLGGLPYIDANRVGIWGWSYGGYISSLALLVGNEVFSTAIAVAPVTNWRFYDTIYTERYLQRPQDNASGYDDNSPSTHAAKLKGNFLLIHGTGDDNVHFQNAVVLQEALINAGKQFQSFYYPDRNHGIGGGRLRLHLYEMMTEFLEKNL